MNRSWVLASLVVAAFAAVLPELAASAEKEKPQEVAPPRAETRTASTAAEASTPVYKPPLRGAPGGRVGGSTRSAGLPVLAVSVLAPDHTGLTTSEHPSLYWHISSTSTAPVEITVLNARAIKPLMQIFLPAPVPAGIHRIRLADHGIRLQPGIAYRWYVAVVQNANRRSKDLLAGGAIERVAADEALNAVLAKASPLDTSARYAEAGLWYDAIASLSTLIESAPEDAQIRRPRAALLAQVGLDAIEQ